MAPLAKMEQQALQVWQLRQQRHSFKVIGEIMGIGKTTAWRRWWLHYYRLQGEGCPFLVEAPGWSRSGKPPNGEPTTPIFGKSMLPPPKDTRARVSRDAVETHWRELKRYRGRLARHLSQRDT